MSVGRLFCVAITGLAVSGLATIDNVQASQWGCEILLCASSSDPSWRGVPACHPPMYRLISAMRRTGFSWPTCPEAGTGRPGYERYDECPTGWNVGYSEHDRGGRQEADLCIQVRNTCSGRFDWRDDCQQTVSMPRPIRENPYYFDIEQDDGGSTRHWFNLRK